MSFDYNHIFEKVLEIVDEDIAIEFNKIPRAEHDYNGKAYDEPLFAWPLDDIIKVQNMRTDKAMLTAINNLVRAINQVQNTHNGSNDSSKD